MNRNFKTFFATLTAVGLLLTTSAKATFYAPEPWQVPEYANLVCIPTKTKTWGKDHSKGNPVVRVYVHSRFNPETAKILEMNIIHELYFGERHDRSKQYDLVSLEQTEKDQAVWGWYGTLKERPIQSMLGILTFTPQKQWLYTEVIGKREHPIFHMEAKCEERMDPKGDWTNEASGD